MKEETQSWFLQAEEHYQDALYLYQGSRYSLSVYSCHQALEKILKAAIVEFAGKLPSKSHNLDALAKESTLALPSDWYEELAEITRHFWRVRYPDFQKYSYTSREKVEPTISKTKEIYLWIKKKFA